MMTLSEPSRRMSCMEIWGGNTAVEDLFQTVGLDLFVSSSPYQSSDVGGGDIYYVTSCASARITRLLLADVSGHGASASGLAITLRDLMRNQVNSIDQQAFVEQMNREFAEAAKDSAFATAVVATYFHPSRSLTIAIAGHPNPLGYDQASGQWKRLVPIDRKGREVGNLPLGVNDSVAYRSGKLDVVPGDMLLMYSDAFIETERSDGSMLGVDGLVELLNELEQEAKFPIRSPAVIAECLQERLKQLSPTALQGDDATLVIGQFTATAPRLRDDAMAPLRLMKSVTDRTSFRS